MEGMAVVSTMDKVLTTLGISGTLIVMGVIAFFVMIKFPTGFAKMFANDEMLINLVVHLIPVYFGALWIFGIQMSAQSTFLGLGKAKTSLFIASLRKIILLIPLALTLPHFMGVEGIFWAEPIASFTSAVTSGILLFVCYKKLQNK